MQATPGEMKSLRSSAERMADMVGAGISIFPFRCAFNSACVTEMDGDAGWGLRIQTTKVDRKPHLGRGYNGNQSACGDIGVPERNNMDMGKINLAVGVFSPFFRSCEWDDAQFGSDCFEMQPPTEKACGIGSSGGGLGVPR